MYQGINYEPSLLERSKTIFCAKTTIEYLSSELVLLKLKMCFALPPNFDKGIIETTKSGGGGSKMLSVLIG